MYRHAAPTQGLRRSPTRAAFQNTPRNPVRCASSKPGARNLTYVHVHTKRRRVVTKDLKSNSADIAGASGRAASGLMKSVFDASS